MTGLARGLARGGPDAAGRAAPSAPLWGAQGVALMGVLNVTPDSFSDGGRWFEPGAAVAHARRMAAEGADVIDVGGESTRPGAAPVDAAEEQARVLPVLRALAPALDVPLSIDTWRAATAAMALEAGARIVNDVRGFLGDPDIARVVAEHGADAILMHWESHEQNPEADILSRVAAGLARSVETALRAGVAQDRLTIDPGVGFGKTPAQNLALIAATGALRREFGLPVLIGASRKRMIVALLGERSPEARLPATLALHVGAVLAGADAIRAHDVAPHADALRMAQALRDAPGRERAPR